MSADAIYTGGDIVTIDDRQPVAEAVAVSHGRISAVGTRDAVLAEQRGSATRMVDLGGRCLLPGFVDPHSHYINSLLVANQVNVSAPPAGAGATVNAIVAALKEFRDRRQIPPGEVIVAYGYDDT